jgi:hypothetical protein
MDYYDVMATACVKTGNTASGGWGNCCVVAEHMHITALFLK